MIHTDSENLERIANALEAIAESAVKLVNPPMALGDVARYHQEREEYIRRQAIACAERTLAEDDEYRGG